MGLGPQALYAPRSGRRSRLAAIEARRPANGPRRATLVSASIRVGTDDFATRDGGKSIIGRGRDTVLEELDRAVTEGHVHPPRVVRARTDQGPHVTVTE